MSSAGSHSVSRDTTRLVAFSDAVFAITITLLVLEIKPPSDYTNLLHDLAALWPSYLAYAVTFLFIGQVGDSAAGGRRQSRGASSSLSRGSP